MNDPSAARLTDLQAEFPGWQIWTVRPLYGPTAWCARRRDDDTVPIRALNAGSPDELAEMIRAEDAETGQVTGRCGSPGPAGE